MTQADEGISGKNIVERPAINRLISDIKEGNVNNVLVFKVDRLTRSTRDLTELLDTFRKYNCAFNSLMESIDTTSASGRMFLKIIGIFAEFERENIIERTRVGCEKKAREGYSVSKNYASYGYTREIGNNIQEIHEDEAEIVREIFDMFVNQDKSLTSIASELNIRKIGTKVRGIWYAKTIKKMLTNANYIGKTRYCINDKERYFEADGRHEGIIAEKLYALAQDKLAKNSGKSYTKIPRDDNYYCGVLECALCGKKITAHGKVKKRKDGTGLYIPHYICTGKLVKACNSKSMGHKKVEEAFLNYLSNIQDLSVADEVEIEYIPPKSDNEILIAEYSGELERLEKREKEIMRFYVDEKIDYENYAEMIRLIKVDRSSYTKKLAEVQEKHNKEEIKLTKSDLILNIRENWELLTNKERLSFVRNNIERIVILNQPIKGKLAGKIKIERVDFWE